MKAGFDFRLDRLWSSPAPKAVLAGLLSVTTTGLLLPAVPTHALAAEVRPHGEVAEGTELGEEMPDSDEKPASDPGSKAEPDSEPGPEPDPEPDPEPELGPDPDPDPHPEPTPPELVEPMRLGDAELISGTEEAFAVYGSGELSCTLRSPSEPVVAINVDGVSCAVNVARPEEAEEVYEVTTSLADGAYDRIELVATDSEGAACAASVSYVIVDTTKPVVRVCYDGRELGESDLHEGKLYMQHRPTITVEVTDDNLDLPSLRIGGVAYDGWQSDGAMHVLELPERVELDVPLSIAGSDQAGNAIDGTAWIVPVVVDAAAPAIVVDKVSPDATVGRGGDASLFFAGQTSVRVRVSDTDGLAAVRVERPGSHTVDDGGFAPGDSEATVTVRLAEGKEFTQETLVTVWDLAGNWRTWSIAENGEASEAGRHRQVGNAPISLNEDGAGVYPLRLLLDTTRPTVEVRGVEDGGVYGRPRVVTICVDEANFAYLQRQAQAALVDQEVLVATLENPKAGEAGMERTPLLRVGDFAWNPASDRWEASVNLAQDGDYTLHSQLFDIVGNASEPVTTRFVIDTTVPVCEVSFSKDDAHAEEHEGAYFRTARRAVLRVREHNWDKLQELRLRYVDEGGEERELSSARFESIGDDWHECTVEFADDGAYRLLLDVTDVAGNKMAPYQSDRFVIDTKDPSISVSYEGPKARGGIYYGGPRTATITTVEHNWGDDARYRVSVEAEDTEPGDAPEIGAWSTPDADKPDVHVCVVSFEHDGRYSLRVEGSDLAGRTAKHGHAEGYSDAFVIDSQAPAVHVGFAPTSYAELDGVKYLNHAIEVPVSVRDRNLDAGHVSLSWDAAKLVGDERIGWDVSAPDETGEVTRSRIVSFGHGKHVSPAVDAQDRAGNRSRVPGEEFVVDLEVPTIVSVSTTTKPSAAYQTERDDERGETQFFGQATQLVFEVSDEYLLDGVGLYDPDGQYRLESAVDRGSASARVVVSLVDDAESHAAEAYGRDIVFTVADIAGNQHGWTLNRRGEVVADEVRTGEDVTLNGSGLEPLALVQDTISPVVAIEGITPGLVSNQTQVARVSVREHNFSYLRAFRPTDTAVRITAHDATPARAERTEDIRVSSFTGDDPSWVYEHEFARDGHYAIEAQVIDVAGHPSNRVELGEFTVDKTAPVIRVTWDHGLDEAHYSGGVHYFKTTRRATVAVEEHNFRARDVVVDAGRAGVVSGWQDVGGDTHVCTVDYPVEAKDCHLVVRATDEAGNEAKPYEQRAFAIDLTSPSVRILNVPGPHGERAFAGEVMPVIVFDDGSDGNFDAGSLGWSYDLRGTREGNVATRGDARRFLQSEQVSDDGAMVTFDEFGVAAKDAGQRFDVSFDDVYTLTATVRDLAGNEAQAASVTFSVNRFGSNFFVEELEGLSDSGESHVAADGLVRPLASAPQIVVHEVNVSGSLSELDHSVVRDFANAPQELPQDAAGERHGPDDAGYSLREPGELSDYNDHEGWAEYVYTIRKGNFGEGAIPGSDGQGIYRVNVASVDAANNQNSTSRFWASDAGRAEASDKNATVTFTLDELPPVIDDLNLGTGPALGASYLATFRVTDDISCGDTVEVLVDGKRVDVMDAGSGQPVDADSIVTGTYAFVVPARAFAPRSVSVKVVDYAGRAATRDGTVLVTTLVAEAGLAATFIAVGALCCALVLRRRALAEPTYPHAE